MVAASGSAGLSRQPYACHSEGGATLLSRLLRAGRSGAGGEPPTAQLRPSTSQSRRQVRARHDERASPSPGHSRLASGPSPTGPALRANPSPEVTDPACRLPLPTLFYRLEAVHLGDLLRLWVRTDAKIARLSLGFSRADLSAPDTARAAVLYGAAVPISGRTDYRARAPYKEKRTLPGAQADVSEFACVAAPGDLARGRAPISAFAFGNVNPIPFR
ncbi:Hypp9754 [Branchiostoma lanceolatum]|uniref:Hypp9754 protein n=1 Tax=Branchiostoma lanceolatum TaxID=7740 RepID=A0A8S4MP82_BRALA|nr:Hypp9754 [Branchiostoma lanceolatum]